MYITNALNEFIFESLVKIKCLSPVYYFTKHFLLNVKILTRSLKMLFLARIYLFYRALKLNTARKWVTLNFSYSIYCGIKEQGTCKFSHPLRYTLNVKTNDSYNSKTGKWCSVSKLTCILLKHIIISL